MPGCNFRISIQPGTAMVDYLTRSVLRFPSDCFYCFKPDCIDVYVYRELSDIMLRYDNKFGLMTDDLFISVTSTDLTLILTKLYLK